MSKVWSHRRTGDKKPTGKIQAALISLYLCKIMSGMKMSFSRLFHVYFVQLGDLIGGARQVGYSLSQQHLENFPCAD